MLAQASRSAAPVLGYSVILARGGARRFEVTAFQGSAVNPQVASLEWLDDGGVWRIMEAVNINAQNTYNRLLGEGGTLPFPDTIRFTLSNPNPGAAWSYYWGLEV